LPIAKTLARQLRDRGAVRYPIRWPRPPRAILIGAATLVIALLGLVAVHSVLELARFERAEAGRTAVFYAAGQPLVPGMHVARIDLPATLARLGYREVAAPPGRPGQFSRTGATWEIVLRGQEGTGVAPGSRLQLDLTGERIARIAREGREESSAALEGEVLAGAGDRPGEESRPVGLADVPPALINAVLAAEDHRFFQHGGVDGRGVLRAVWANLRARRIVQGGSTLTQQLVRARLLTPERTLLRKLDEAWLAMLVELRHSKRDLLAAYLNEVYLGQRGPLAIRGVGAAARVYFGKEVHQLTTGEAALLAGMLRAPNTTSPALDPARARRRRQAVLARMRELDLITADEYERARREPVRAVAWSAAAGQPGPYFVDHVRQELERRFDDGLRGRADVRVFTTLDRTLQRFAENAVARGLDRLETAAPRLRRGDPRDRLQVALVALDSGTGEVRAMVGGRDYQTSQFNRATMARRQPGSAFKPFVYAAALRPRDGGPAFTPASLVDDAPIAITARGKSWTPRNYEDRYEGRVTVRRALEQSLNGATVRIAQAVGPMEVVHTARVFGLGDRLAPVPAVALGVFEVTPLELARAYLAFANHGLLPRGTTAVRAVAGAAGLPEAPPGAPARPAISPAEAYLMTALLQGVVRSGTGAPVRAHGLADPVAGKTGTTNEGRDAWFAGYSSRLTAVVWVGFDDGAPLGLSASQVALPIWAEFMRQAQDAYPAPAFAVPPGVSFADVDPTNGLRANAFCPIAVREVFLSGSEPGPCHEHGAESAAVADWWQRLRDWFRR
jgi:penicillin-binding protein 1B